METIDSYHAQVYEMLEDFHQAFVAKQASAKWLQIVSARV